ncbi:MULTISPECIES: hypothetical protein [Sporosarcina]|uniref:hypothetical protein n=1 Tax=Sporosarcina TaxID=1569 RepID=UPI00059464E7|nr:hypothetical protein [Sporosarcina newyorkensis]
MTKSDIHVLAFNNAVRVDFEEHSLSRTVLLNVVGKERNRIRFIDAVERMRPVNIQYLYKQERFILIARLKRYFKGKVSFKGGEKN